MKCAICNQDRNGKEYRLDISGGIYQFFICDQCETEKGKAYDDFFDDIRERVKPKEE